LLKFSVDGQGRSLSGSCTSAGHFRALSRATSSEDSSSEQERRRCQLPGRGVWTQRPGVGREARNCRGRSRRSRLLAALKFRLAMWNSAQNSWRSRANSPVFSRQASARSSRPGG